MKIVIDYESSWRNSFLDGNNNEPLPKNGRNFVASMKQLSDKPQVNYKTRDVTHSTVMGILNRLIGDQRKLYQSRMDKNYFFKNLEQEISFRDKPMSINHEFAFIRNISGNEDRESYAGIIRSNAPLFKADFSPMLWGVLQLNLDELYDFILNNSLARTFQEPDPISITAKIVELSAYKPIENIADPQKCLSILVKNFEGFNGLNNKGLILPVRFYFAALYLQLKRLSSQHDVSIALTKAGKISGISLNSFTKKDFMGAYSTGGKKKVWGNPFLLEEYVSGEGKTKRLLKKASGQLHIEIPVEKQRGKELIAMIENAGVSSFYLGKKGLAYVSKMRA